MLVTLIVAVNVLFSRFWTQNYGYKPSDFTVDTFLLLGILMFPFWIKTLLGQEYSTSDIVFGVSASICFIPGVFLMMYAAT